MRTELDGLRDYQQELLEQAETALQVPKARVMLQLPTGGGKTHIAGALLADRLQEGRKAVWLTHRAELAEQTCRMLTDADVTAINRRTWPTQYDAPATPNGVVILMAQTVGRRTNAGEIWRNYNSEDLLVIDEAHHAAADGWERAIKQWPGEVIGLTATPWRLSKTEGFSHLFGELRCGPQVSQLQAEGWLCDARTLIPQPEEIIRGGAITATGDYNESGIEQANRDRPDVMTADALRFWQFHAAERQTIIYAISKEHAHNLTAVFKEAGIPAAAILGDTPPEERAKAIKSFGDRTVRALVNVAVATEGFDLPDASCVVITRPTMSLALYLQMVGRGLRPKSGRGNCLILDLAGNAEIHGLPEENRQWSLLPRGSEPEGDAPVVRCENCDAISPAASQNCANCGVPFGKDCSRCGKWRARMRWSYETHCGDLHDLVCDLCHYDAHIQGRLPVSDELLGLDDLNDSGDEEMAIELEPGRNPFLMELLEEERRRVEGKDDERKNELRSLIAARESALTDDNRLVTVFEKYIVSLPLQERPQTDRRKFLLYPEWEGRLKQELTDWKSELEKLEAKVINGQLIYNNARERVLQLLALEARDAGLLAQTLSRETPSRRPIVENSDPASAEISGWATFSEMGAWSRIEPKKGTLIKPSQIRDPRGKTISVNNWVDLFFQTAEHLVERKLLTAPFTFETMTKRHLIHSEPVHPNGREFKFGRQLSNGLFLECQWGSKSIARLCPQLLAEFGQDPEQFQVLVS